MCLFCVAYLRFMDFVALMNDFLFPAMATELHRVRLFTFLRNGSAAVTFVYFSTNQIARLPFAESGAPPVRSGLAVFVYTNQIA